VTSRYLAVLDVVLAAGVLALIAYSVSAADAPQFATKAMTTRAICYPFSLVLVPIGVWISSRGGRRRSEGRSSLPYPHVLGILVTMPFIIDLGGNALDLYDSIEHFDDWVHMFNPVLFVIAACFVIASTGIPRWAVAVMGFGVGNTFHIAWELIEGQVLMQLANVDLGITLADTLSDLAWGLVGSGVGVAVALTTLHLRSRA
jgi:hypothetical protein